MAERSGLHDDYRIGHRAFKYAFDSLRFRSRYCLLKCFHRVFSPFQLEFVTGKSGQLRVLCGGKVMICNKNVDFPQGQPVFGVIDLHDKGLAVLLRLKQ